MTQDEKYLISIEIDKYFRSTNINNIWLSAHFMPEIEMPDDGFKPQSLSSVIIEPDSIGQIATGRYYFSGSAKAFVLDEASKVGSWVGVEFSGHAFTETSSERTFVKDIALSGFNRTTEIIPNSSNKA